jgi:hypothetical protein
MREFLLNFYFCKWLLLFGATEYEGYKEKDKIQYLGRPI